MQAVNSPTPPIIPSTPAAEVATGAGSLPPLMAHPIDLSPMTFQRFGNEAMTTAARFAPSVLGALVFFIAAWVVSGAASRGLFKVLTKAHVEPTIVKFLSTLLRWGLIVLSAVACLGMFGVNIAAYAAVLGAAGLAVGLALQGSLSNLAAGVMLLLLRPFKVGDAIIVAGQGGVVESIDLFSTNLDTIDNRRIIIPNAEAFNAIVENTSHHELRRVDISIGVEYAADIAATRRALTAALDSIPEVLDEPASTVLQVRFGKSAIEWQLGAWCKRGDFVAVQQACMQAAQDHLNRAGIKPVPML